MPGRSLATAALVACSALLAPSLLGCPRAVPEPLAKHGYERVASDVLEAPAGAPSSARFVRARVLVHYHVGKPVWGFMAEAERKLVVTRRAEGGAAGEADAVLRLGYRRARWGEEPGPFLDWSDRTRWELRLAPDGHALAISDDAGAHWGYVALDVPRRPTAIAPPDGAPPAPPSPPGPPPGSPDDEPFACLHLRAAGSDPWAVLPTTHALTRAILMTSVEGGRAVGHPSEEGSGFDPSELRGALRFACAHPEDAALGRDVAAALLRDRISASIWDLPTRTKVVACLGAFARADAGTRDALLAVLQAAAPRSLEARSWAAEGLAGVSDASVQRALALDLERLMAERPRFGQCDLAAREAWALAAVTAARREAPPEVEQTALRLVKSELGCLGGPTMDLVRAHLVRALAALPTAGARAATDALAVSCGAALPRWPDGFENEWEVASKSDWTVPSAACWAAAARARR